MLSLLPLLLSSSSVVGGTTVQPGEWPDAVAVLSATSVCTGTLIAPDVVLTAGHCIDPAPIYVVVDSVDYGKPGGDPIRVKSALAYPAWEDSYDVGLLILDRAATAPPRAVAAGCMLRETLVAGAPVHLVGFGRTTAAGTGQSSRLYQGDAPVLDATCRDPQACVPAVAPGGEFIAGGNGVSSCFGDSGGPVYIDTPDGPALAGVVSRGFARTGPPCAAGGVYVRADKVVPWIEQVTRETVARTDCAGASDEVTAEPEGVAPSGGCAATGGAGDGLVLGLGALAGIRLVRRRRRRA